MRSLVNIPGRANADIPVYDSKVPTPETVTVLPLNLLKVVMWFGEQMMDLNDKWGVGGDAGEIIKGVHRKTDHIEILTTKAGCDAICKLLPDYLTVPPSEREIKSQRDADVNGQMYPVFFRSHYAELTYNNVRIEIHGDEQIKVGEWDWGDPLDFEPDYTTMVRLRIPVVPLRLKQELDLGLGWLDRLDAIGVAIASGQHHLAEGGVRPAAPKKSKQ